MQPKGHSTKRKTRLIHVGITVLFIAGLLALISYGTVYFSPKTGNSSLFLPNQAHRQEVVQKEFADSYRRFLQALAVYLTRPAFLIGVVLALLVYSWMILRLFADYFKFFKKVLYLDLLLHPRAVENIPHCLVVLLVYFVYLGAGALDTIMMVSYVLISMPFVYKMMEDGFLAAEREGTIEIYLNKCKTDTALIREFLGKRPARLVIIPILFMVMLMIYWDFLYASIGITGDADSAPAVFFTNFNDEFLVSYTAKHDILILLHIGSFVLLMFAILYFISLAGEKEHE